MSHSLVETFSHWPVMQRPRFHPRPTHVGYVVDKMVLGHVCPEVTQFFPVSFIPWLLYSSFLNHFQCYIIALESVIK